MPVLPLMNKLFKVLFSTRSTPYGNILKKHLHLRIINMSSYVRATDPQCSSAAEHWICSILLWIYLIFCTLLVSAIAFAGMELPGNGKSDHLPAGMVITAYDMLYSVVLVVRHFRWEKFIYLAHSFGSSLGKMYALAFPDKLLKLIEIDPINQLATLSAESFGIWFQKTFSEYANNQDKYHAKEFWPKYKKDEAIEKLVKNRSLTKETAAATIARWSEPTEDGNIRFTFDQRLKIIIHYPLSPKLLKELYTNIKTPMLTLVAKDSLDKGLYDNAKILLDEKSFPKGNCRVRTIAGHHDVHVVHPERMAPYIANFLLHGLKGLDDKSRL